MFKFCDSWFFFNLHFFEFCTFVIFNSVQKNLHISWTFMSSPSTSKPVFNITGEVSQQTNKSTVLQVSNHPNQSPTNLFHLRCACSTCYARTCWTAATRSAHYRRTRSRSTGRTGSRSIGAPAPRSSSAGSWHSDNSATPPTAATDSAAPHPSRTGRSARSFRRPVRWWRTSAGWTTPGWDFAGSWRWRVPRVCSVPAGTCWAWRSSRRRVRADAGTVPSRCSPSWGTCSNTRRHLCTLCRPRAVGVPRALGWSSCGTTWRWLLGCSSAGSPSGWLRALCWFPLWRVSSTWTFPWTQHWWMWWLSSTLWWSWRFSPWVRPRRAFWWRRRPRARYCRTSSPRLPCGSFWPILLFGESSPPGLCCKRWTRENAKIVVDRYTYVTVGAFLVGLVLSELPLRSRSTLTRRLSRPGVLDRDRVRGSDTSCGFGWSAMVVSLVSTGSCWRAANTFQSESKKRFTISFEGPFELIYSSRWLFDFHVNTITLGSINLQQLCREFEKEPIHLLRFTTESRRQIYLLALARFPLIPSRWHHSG